MKKLGKGKKQCDKNTIKWRRIWQAKSKFQTTIINNNPLIENSQEAIKDSSWWLMKRTS